MQRNLNLFTDILPARPEYSLEFMKANVSKDAGTASSRSILRYTCLRAFALGQALRTSGILVLTLITTSITAEDDRCANCEKNNNDNTGQQLTAHAFNVIINGFVAAQSGDNPEKQNQAVVNALSSVSNIFQIAFKSYENIVVRPAEEKDLPQVFELDRRVTFEFFQPLFKETYAQLGIVQNVESDLNDELTTACKWFPECVKAHGSERLYIAWDTLHDLPCGLIVFHQNDIDTVEIDLLEIDAAYRGIGIGKRLVQSIFDAFSTTKTCIVYPLRSKNENTLKFYASLGFKNLGIDPRPKRVHGIPCADLYCYLRYDVTQPLRSRLIDTIDTIDALF